MSLAATAAWISPAALAASRGPTSARPAVAAISGILSGVAATSASNAWATGTAGTTRTSSLALHWNGKAWSRVSAPGTGLGSVAASSAGNAWAIGASGSAQLIVHWNGHSWKSSAVSLPKGAFLTGVTTTSPGNVWAVGETQVGSKIRTLTVHWNGHAWKRVPSPSPGAGGRSGDLLTAVTAVSARNAWAVGAVTSTVAGPVGTLILHWNGRSWTHVSSTSLIRGASGGLGGVTATSAGNAWLDGCACAGGPDGGVIGHWNGHSWAGQRNPVHGRFGAALTAISASSRSSAFAVGNYCKSACTTAHSYYTDLILRWTGSAWKIAASPSPRGAVLTAVADVSARSAWAVGEGSSSKILLLHWNGRSWQSAG